MKKGFLFLMTILLSLSMQAKVGLLIPDSRSDAETAAATWFDAVNHADREEITLTDDMDLSGYSTIWVMVDRSTDVSGFNSLFNDARKGKLTTFVQNGGNLLLCKQATMLAYTMGRIGYAPNFATFTTSGEWEGVGRSIYTRMGSGSFLSDQSSHPLYDSDNKDAEPLCQYDRDSNARIFLMHTATNSNYRYCSWLEVYNKNLAKGGNNNTPEIREAFENDWQATILALRGGIGDYCFTDIIFFKKGEDKTSEGRLDFSAWKGNILAIGSAAYLWGSENATPELTNVEKLTENALSYLESLYEPEPEPEPEPVIEPDPAADMAYLLPEELATLKTSQPAEYNAAKWFQDEYIGEGKPGKFITKDQISGLYAAGIRVLWVHTDRTGIETTYADDYKAALAAYVKAGGNLLLTKQATYLAHSMGRIGYAPNFATFTTSGDWEGVGRSIYTRMGTDSYLSDQSNHPLYDSDNKDAEPLCQYDRGSNARIFLMHSANSTNYRYCSWLEVYNKDLAKGGGNASSAIREAFENDWQATILALRGGIGDYCFTDIVYFKKGENKTAEGGLNFSDWKGHILTIGSAAYWWGTDNTTPELTNVQELTKNGIKYLHKLNCVYTRATTAGRYGTICLERAAQTIEGATFFTPVEIVRNSSDQIVGINLEEVDASDTKAGVGYYFLAEASELKVTMDPEVLALKDTVAGGAATHGMHGTFYGSVTVPNTMNELILNNNKLWYGANNTVGEHRAWIKLNELEDWINENGSSPAPGRRRVTMAVDHTNVTTAVENSELQSGETLKLMQNGQIYILRSGACYTIDGRLVK